MGAHSTMQITRDDALQYIIDGLFKSSDAELEDILFQLYGDKTLYRFDIVSEYDYESGYYQFRKKQDED